MGHYQLIACQGCGSAIVEMALEICGVSYRMEILPYLEPGPGRDRLLELNPTGQVPVLTLPDGTVMSESAAIILYLAENFTEAGLAPPPGSPGRPLFLRWMLFLVSQIYPTFNYGDDPRQWVGDGQAADRLRESTDAHRLRLWQVLEEQAAAGPWFLGDHMTAIDIYLTVMQHWRPGPVVFDARFPRLATAAKAAAEHPVIARVLARNM